MKICVMRSLIFVFAMFIGFAVHAQSNQERFKKTFDEEIQEEGGLERTSHSAKYQHTAPQKLPEWITQIPSSTRELIYAVGISDPAMDSTEGMQQAVFRAELMANVFRKSTTQLLCDFFLDEEASSSSIVYEHYSRISTKMPMQKHQSEIIQSFKNQYDETIVLVAYHPPKRVDPAQLLNIRMEMYKNETESSIYGQFESVFDLMVKTPTTDIAPYGFYELTELGERSSVVSSDTVGKYEVPIYTLAYHDIPAKDSVNNCFFTHGLWKEYYQSTMNHIMSKAREKPENISYLTDKYQVENYQKLTRGVSVNKMRFTLDGFYAENGKLMVKLTEQDL